MKVLIQFLGGFQHLVAEQELELTLATGDDVRHLIEELDHTFGPELIRHLLTPDGEQRAGLVMLVNGHNVSLGKGLRTELQEGDRVAFLPVIGGGSSPAIPTAAPNSARIAHMMWSSSEAGNMSPSAGALHPITPHSSGTE